MVVAEMGVLAAAEVTAAAEVLVVATERSTTQSLASCRAHKARLNRLHPHTSAYCLSAERRSASVGLVRARGALELART